MRKIVKRFCIFIVIFLFTLPMNLDSYAMDLDYEKGHLKLINQENLPVKGAPIKLLDGRVLFISNKENYIYNPNNETFKLTVSSPLGFSYVSNKNGIPAIVLRDGKVLHFGEEFIHPFYEFEKKLRPEIINSLTASFINVNPNYIGLNLYEKEQIQNKLYENFRLLPNEDKEKLYLPLIKPNKNLYNKYIVYSKKRDFYNQHALLFDPTNESYEIIPTTIFKFKNKYMSDFFLAMNQNGDVLILSEHGEIHRYNASQKTFSIVDETKHFKQIYDIIQINNSQLFVLLPNGNYTLFNMNTNSYSEILKLPQSTTFSFIKYLSDNKLLLIGNSANPYFAVFNLEDNSIRKIALFSFNRLVDNDFFVRSLALPNNKFIIFGGLINEYQSGFLNTKYKKFIDAELIDASAGKAKILKVKFLSGIRSCVLLDNGNILIDGLTEENNVHKRAIYIPKVIRNKE